MKEYIDRTVVKVKILSWAVCIDNPKLLSKEDTMYCIDNIPAANVAEVRHGRWEKFVTASGIISRVRCSVCAGTQSLKFENMPYCPTCGARMGKEDEHEAS